MAKSLNPMEAFRREQKKKELKKHRVERHKDKQSKLSSMDPTELREQLKALERQVTGNPSDGPTRKRKQELEETLRAVVKKHKEVQDEERKKQQEAPPPPPMSATELKEANRDKFQNPENSVYYHPTMNPFGAPPPGMPQRYRGMPPPGSTPPRQGGQQQRHRGPPSPPRGPPQFGGRGPPPAPMQPRAMARRPGKRPPLPRGPPPPGTIQVPSRPPLPSGAIPLRPPPPPPMHAQTAGAVMPQQPRAMMPPPPPYPRTTEETEADQDADDSVVAPYPTTDEPNFDDQELDEEAAERAAESQAQLRSLVPVALRIQRKASAHLSSAAVPPVPAPRRPVPAPRPAMPSIVSAPLPPTSATSVSKEFDAFMEEVQDLL